MKEQLKGTRGSTFHRWCITLAVFAAALFFQPVIGHAQGPPPSGNCKACTTGTYLKQVDGVWIEYTDATFCANGTIQGWNNCSANPPYGPCTVSGGACSGEEGLLSIPEGVIEGSPGASVAYAKPCPAADRGATLARVVRIDDQQFALVDAISPVRGWLHGSADAADSAR